MTQKNGKVKADKVEDELINAIDKLNSQWQDKLHKVEEKQTMSLAQMLETEPKPMSIDIGLQAIKDNLTRYVTSKTSKERKEALALAFAGAARVKDVVVNKEAFLRLYGRLKNNEASSEIPLNTSVPNPYKLVRIQHVAPVLRKLARNLNLAGDYVDSKLELQSILSHLPF